ncbi:uncharacterized protein LOC143563021 [Bidens hawaiensis]|uniref:uncharacterized protein LOC143563021 n=1 Tax=Bidens hawaiensis TaxID=980011 RepID=UPI004049BCBF
MYSVTLVVLIGIIKDVSHTTFDQRGDADAAHQIMHSFEFVFILHLMKEVLGRTNTLSQALQKKNQDIHNSTALVSSTKFGFQKINVDEICLLVEKYNPEDFTEPEKIPLRDQLVVFNVEMTNNTKLRGVSCISDLCKYLMDTQKCETYYLVDRLIQLILTLPVSTATTERGFSAMKIFKNRLRNKMSNEYLTNSLVIYIEKEIAETFDSEFIINEFKDLKGRRAAL